MFPFIRGVESDVVERSGEKLTPVIRVGFGQCMEDDIPSAEETPGQISVTKWTYQCIIRCPTTGEKVKSKSVNIQV